MKHHLLFCLGLLALFTLPARAGLKWESTEMPVAMGGDDTTAKTEFVFHNEGPDEVRIVKVSPSCGCTIAELAKTVYAAGETGRIAVEFHRGGRVGEARILISVETQPETERKELTLVANIAEDVVLGEHVVVWKTGEPRTPRKVRVTIVSKASAEVGVPKVTSTAFSAKLTPADDTGRLFDLAITPPAGELPAMTLVSLPVRVGGKQVERRFTLIARAVGAGKKQ